MQQVDFIKGLAVILKMKFGRQRYKRSEHLPLGFDGIDDCQIDREEGNDGTDRQKQRDKQRSSFSQSHASTSFRFMTPIWMKVKIRIITNRITDLALAYP
ncbi:hypothetical protein D3C75_544430 [compost metagenome]